MSRLTRVLAAATAVAAAALATPASVQAVAATSAVYAADGQACTIVGTAGSDTLEGTSGRDVICGRGGSDVIRAGGGSDVIDGGSGNDVIAGGGGSDTVYGDSGADVVSGGDGDDVLKGGAGPDTETGGSDDDVVYGGDGDDDLTGGGGADAINGNDDTNWCTFDAADTEHRHCVYDVEAPHIGQVRVSTDHVDVTEDAAQVRIRVHVTDDTGLDVVRINGNHSGLVAGDVRDGWWRTTITVPRWAEPGWRDLQIDVHDRVHKPASREFLDVFKVIDANPDSNLPRVRDITWPTKVDVRTEGKTIRFKAHITDDASGVADTYVCMIYPSDGAYLQYDACPSLELVSGTRRDGVWAADVRMRRDSVGGDYSLSVYVVDRAHEYGKEYMGPAYYRYFTNDGANPTDYFAQLPNNEGDFTVLGISDPTAPVLQSLSITPNDIDTLPGPVTVGVDFHLVDDDGDGIRSIGGVVCSGDNTQCFWGAEAIETPTSGNRANGWWHIDVDFPQGVSPGTYYLQVWAQDAGHWRSWISPGSPGEENVAGDPSFAVLNADQLGADPGVVTVVNHQP